MYKRIQSRDARPLRETLAGMTPKQKLEHLCTYYSWVLLAVIAVIVVIAIVVSCIQAGRIEVLVGGYVMNINVSEEGEYYLRDGWFQSLGGNEKTQKVNYTSSYLSSSSMNTAFMQVISMIAAQELDYVISDESGMQAFMGQSAFVPLETLLTEEQLAQWSDHLVYHTYGSTDETEYAIAIDISDTAFAQDCLTSVNSVYIAFPGNRDDGRDAGEILDYLLSWNG